MEHPPAVISTQPKKAELITWAIATYKKVEPPSGGRASFLARIKTKRRRRARTLAPLSAGNNLSSHRSRRRPRAPLHGPAALTRDVTFPPLCTLILRRRTPKMPRISIVIHQWGIWSFARTVPRPRPAYIHVHVISPPLRNIEWPPPARDPGLCARTFHLLFPTFLLTPGSAATRLFPNFHCCL